MADDSCTELLESSSCPHHSRHLLLYRLLRSSENGTGTDGEKLPSLGRRPGGTCLWLDFLLVDIPKWPALPHRVASTPLKALLSRGQLYHCCQVKDPGSTSLLNWLSNTWPALFVCTKELRLAILSNRVRGAWPNPHKDLLKLKKRGWEECVWAHVLVYSFNWPSHFLPLVGRYHIDVVI